MYHHDQKDELRVRGELGGLRDVPPYAVVEIGPIVFYDLSPEQLREAAAAIARAADELERQQAHATEAAE